MLNRIKKFVLNILHPAIGEVWELHRVTNVPAETELQRAYEITSGRLEGLIKEYIAKDYTFISMADVHRVMSGEIRLKNKFVAVTLDDGFEDNFLIAYPILKKYNIPFCIYVMQLGVVGERSPHFPQFLHEDQILKLDKEPLCTFGSHTYSHPRLAELNYEDQFREIVTCHKWLEDLLQHQVVDFSYPFGSYNLDTVSILKEIGIRQCPLAWGGEIHLRKVHPLRIPRVLVTETEIKK